MKSPAGSLLCVVNFPANTGYAWRFIESLYRGVAESFAERGIGTWVAYPEMKDLPATLTGSPATPIELEIRLDSWHHVRALREFIRAHDVRAIYFTDRSAWNPAYPLLRLWGVRVILAHDHTSGDRTSPTGLRRMAKWFLRRLPGFIADEIVAVSDFVKRRKVRVEMLPEKRIHRIWNSLEPVHVDPEARSMLHARFQVEARRSIVACACRSVEEKGVIPLLRAFDRMLADWPACEARPVLVYMGDGPFMPGIRDVWKTLASREDIVIAGYVENAAELLAGAEICVVPSLWEEAFGLAALEPMAAGVPVIVSSAGGLPEVVEHDVSGFHVKPGDIEGIAQQMRSLLLDESKRKKVGAAAIERARTVFSRERSIRELVDLLSPAFDGM